MPTYDIPTLGDIRTTIYRRGGFGTVVAGSATCLEIDAQANRVAQEIHNAGDWWWKRTTTTLLSVVNQAYIALPTDFQAIYLPELVTTDKLHRIYIIRDPAEFDRKRNAFTTTSEAQWAMPEWYNAGTPPFPVLSLVPTPNVARTYTFPYKRKLTPIATSADRPNIPEHWLPAYEARILYRVQLSVRGRETADRYWREAKEAWNDALDTEDGTAHVSGNGVPESNTRELTDNSSIDDFYSYA